jgi:Ca2+-binding RTX toxin-like protein
MLMSFLRRGNRRGHRKAAVVLATVGSLLGFQALAAVPAFAVVTCTFSGGVMTINTDPNDTVEVQQNDVSGTIEVNGVDCVPVAPIATTTAIQVNGDTGDEVVTIDMYDTGGATVDWGAVNWTIDLGSDVLDADEVVVDNSGGDDSVDVAAGASGIDLNNDADLDVTHAGVELLTLTGGLEDDTLSAAGSTAAGAAFATDVTINGGAGDDTVSGGAGDDAVNGDAGDDTVAGGLGDDSLDGGADEDAADFSASATAVNANIATGNATGQGLDTLIAIEDLIGSPQGDTLTGDGGPNIITPGAGDDKVDGAAGIDEVDYSDATAAVTVDLAANTVTGGSGNDSIAAIENATGSDFDDTFVDQTGQDNAVFGGAGADTFQQGADDSDDVDTVDGEGGIDTVDYGVRTNAVLVNLGAAASGATAGTCNDAVEFTSGESGETDCLAALENAVLGLGDDTFLGNSFPNRVFPNGGQNVLNGDLPLGPFTGGDVLDYSVGYTAGVNVNMAGGATAGDSAVGFENAIGTAFNDKFVGDGQSNTIRGAGGNDGIRSGGGDDTARGGPGNDRLRTGSGDDDAFGGAGNDRINGGGGVDFCKGGPGVDRVRGCEQGHA